MVRRFSILAVLAVLGAFLVPWVHAEDQSEDYLYGRWVVGARAAVLQVQKSMNFAKTVLLNAPWVMGKRGRVSAKN